MKTDTEYQKGYEQCKEDNEELIDVLSTYLHCKSTDGKQPLRNNLREALLNLVAKFKKS